MEEDVMSKKRPWLPGKRVAKLAMATRWKDVFAVKAVEWKIPADVTTVFNALISEAGNSLAMLTSADRTPSAVPRCNDAFAALVAKMRYIKRHFLLKPPLTDADFIDLGLILADENKTSQGDPDRPPVFTLKSKDYCQIAAVLHAEGTARIAIPDWAAGAVMLLQLGGERPTSPKALLTIELITRAHYTILFDPADCGKKAYISFQWQNGKGKKGPPAPIQEITIP
jgi:hypothetical protein